MRLPKQTRRLITGGPIPYGFARRRIAQEARMCRSRTDLIEVLPDHMHKPVKAGYSSSRSGAVSRTKIRPTKSPIASRLSPIPETDFSACRISSSEVLIVASPSRAVWPRPVSLSPDRPAARPSRAYQPGSLDFRTSWLGLGLRRKLALPLGLLIRYHIDNGFNKKNGTEKDTRTAGYWARSTDWHEMARRSRRCDRRMVRSPT